MLKAAYTIVQKSLMIILPAIDAHRYSYENAPIQKELQAREVGNAAAFLLSPLASAITGTTLYVDNGLNCMGMATDSQALVRAEEPAKK